MPSLTKQSWRNVSEQNSKRCATGMQIWMLELLQEFGEKTQGVWGKDPRRLGKGSGSINVMIDKKNAFTSAVNVAVRSSSSSKKQQLGL